MISVLSSFFRKYFTFGNRSSVPTFSDDMQVENMGTATTEHHIAIPINELDESLEAAKDKKPGKHDEETEEKGECRYCQDEELVSELEAPCGCNGSLKYAHRSCISHWCQTKGNIMCEICKQPYYPNYSVSGLVIFEDDEIDMEDRWRIPGTNTRILTPLQLLDCGINGLLRSMNTEFNLRHPIGGCIFGTALLIFMAVLVIIDAYHYESPKEDHLSHILYCAVAIITLPIYILSLFAECR